jgi:hypothetical protein
MTPLEQILISQQSAHKTKQMTNRNKTPDVIHALPEVNELIAKKNKNKNRHAIIQFQLKPTELETVKAYAKSQNTDVSKLMRAFVTACINTLQTEVVEAKA